MGRREEKGDIHGCRKSLFRTGKHRVLLSHVILQVIWAEVTGCTARIGTVVVGMVWVMLLFEVSRQVFLVREYWLKAIMSNFGMIE